MRKTRDMPATKSAKTPLFNSWNPYKHAPTFQSTKQVPKRIKTSENTRVNKVKYR